MARVLIVDDNEDIRMLLQMVLEGDGHAVETAASGRIALDCDDIAKFDLVLLDVQMPEQDGWATLAALRASHGDRPAAALCTVKSHPADLVRGFELGADGYLSKPFDLVQLLSQVRQLIGEA